jgi:hypothetical protein
MMLPHRGGTNTYIVHPDSDTEVGNETGPYERLTCSRIADRVSDFRSRTQSESFALVDNLITRESRTNYKTIKH